MHARSGRFENDDGTGTIAFGASAYQKAENGGSATITVTRSGGLGGGMTAQYATTNGTASAGTDYTATSGTLTFAAGVTSLSFQVPITNDTRDEVTETVNLSLSNPAGGAVLGTRRTASLNIVDNDTGGVLSFSSGAYERSESGGNATIKVLRTGGAASGVTVHYATSAATANANDGLYSSDRNAQFRGRPDLRKLFGRAQERYGQRSKRNGESGTRQSDRRRKAGQPAHRRTHHPRRRVSAKAPSR